jgi:hypothetical protein
VVNKRKFSGGLARPIKGVGRSSLLFDEEERKRWIEAELLRILKERLAKVPLLMRHYGIPDEENGSVRALALLLRLAEDFVPGFKLDSDYHGRGRKRPGQKAEDLDRLLMKVISKKLRDPRMTDRQACELILKEGSKRHLPGLEKKARSLANQLSMARNPKHNPNASWWQLLLEMVDQSKTSTAKTNHEK